MSSLISHSISLFLFLKLRLYWFLQIHFSWSKSSFSRAFSCCLFVKERSLASIYTYKNILQCISRVNRFLCDWLKIWFISTSTQLLHFLSFFCRPIVQSVVVLKHLSVTTSIINSHWNEIWNSNWVEIECSHIKPLACSYTCRKTETKE